VVENVGGWVVEQRGIGGNLMVVAVGLERDRRSPTSGRSLGPRKAVGADSLRWLLMVPLWGSRLTHLATTAVLDRGCSRWQKARWHGRSTVAVLGGQGSGDGEHKEENMKRESSVLSSPKIKGSTRWPVHVGGETMSAQSETVAIDNLDGRGLKWAARCGDADEWAPPGLDIF
jgi:hypothetical protein